MSPATATATPPTDEAQADLAKKWPSHFEIVPLRMLFVDKYQRALTSLAEEIGEDFNPAMFGSLTLSLRGNGKYAIIDGQTRFRGALLAIEIHQQKLAAGEQEPDDYFPVPDAVPGLVFEDLTVADEAVLFSDLQRKRRNIATYQRFHADVIARRPMALAIKAILKDFGLEVGPKKDAQLQAVAALESVWKKDPDLLRRVVRVITQVWPLDGTMKARDVFSAEMVRGLARFLSGEGVDDDRLITRLKGSTNPGQLKLRAGMLREGKGGGGATATYMADALVTEYTRRG